MGIHIPDAGRFRRSILRIFPLFYSTSFGGAYWLWLLILLSFILQAVSYEFRRKSGNLYGTRTYDAFLVFNGVADAYSLGVAVGVFFFGGQFTVTKKQHPRCSRSRNITMGADPRTRSHSRLALPASRSRRILPLPAHWPPCTSSTT